MALKTQGPQSVSVGRAGDPHTQTSAPESSRLSSNDPAARRLLFPFPFPCLRFILRPRPSFFRRISANRAFTHSRSDLAYSPKSLLALAHIA